MSGTEAQSAVLTRIRGLLADETDVRVVSMFGGRSVMVHDKMIVSALKDGSLLVRVDAERHDELLDLSGASQAEMGAGRSMGPGWIEVEAAALNDEGLETWFTAAMDHNLAARVDGRESRK